MIYDDGPLDANACEQSKQLIKPFLPLLEGFNNPSTQVHMSFVQLYVP